MIEYIRDWEDTPLMALVFVGVSLLLSLFMQRPPEAYVLASMTGIAVYVAMVLKQETGHVR